MRIDRKRFCSLALSCNCVAAVCLGVLLLSLTGCTLKHREEPYLVLENASITGPNGRVELEAATKRSKGRTPKWSLNMWTPAENRERLLSFHPLTSRGALLYIRRQFGPSGPSFEVIDIFYQLNDADKIVLESIETRLEQGSNGWSSARLWFTRPGNLADIVNVAHGSHLTSMIESINDQNGDIHRFYVKFIVNDKPYVLDASFKIKLDTIWYSNGRWL